jgi:uncharacterized protein (TIGR02270 family)
MEALIEHEDAEVRRVALRASLAWGSARAWANCTKQAFSGDAQHSESIALFASLSTHKQSAQLIELLEREELKATVLFALGFSGNRDVVPVLIEHLSGDDRSIAKLAAQSIQIITGLDTQADEYALPIPEPGDPIELPPPNQDPDAQASLPPIDQDDLDANLVPIPEDAMPDPDAEAIRRYWEKAQSGFSPSQRYLLGQPVSVSSLLDALERARMRVRHVLAQQLGIRTGGQCWLDTTMLISDQRARLAELRGLQVRSFARQFGYA